MISLLARIAHLLVAVALVSLLPLAGSAQVTPAPVEGRAWRGFAWEAARGSERVLLLGTIHVGRPQFAALDPNFLLRVLEAKAFVFEANVFDAQAAAEATQRVALYPEGSPGLDERLDAGLFARLEKIIERAGANLAPCCRMKPWMIANTLVVLESVRAGFHPAYGSEARLFELAQATGKRTSSIESVEAQLRLFDDVPESTQVEYLRHTVETIESGATRAEIDRLVSAWARGDGNEMDRLADEMARSKRPAERFVYERIIKDRHPKMLAAIERHAAAGELHLVAIGALHFFGPDGLLRLLRERGYAVRRLP